MDRRHFMLAAAGGAAKVVLGPLAAGAEERPMGKEPRAGVRAKITEVRVVRLRPKGKAGGGAAYVEVATDAGAAGLAAPMVKEHTDRLRKLAGRVRELLVGKDPRRRELDSEALW
ncbi:MAG: hypothetical protein WBF17_16820, partial [Phycisphaerae bacterium]